MEFSLPQEVAHLGVTARAVPALLTAVEAARESLLAEPGASAVTGADHHPLNPPLSADSGPSHLETGEEKATLPAEQVVAQG